MIRSSILRASENYIFSENRSIWNETWFKEAYLSYFIFTQTARLFYCFHRTQGLFDYSKVSKVVDFGCGPASAHIAAAEALKNKALSNVNWINIDQSEEALNLAKIVEKIYDLKSTFKNQITLPEAEGLGEMLILSFSLCEGFDYENISSYDHVLILEPGQHKESKNLIQLRQKLLSQGFYAIAPCTHQASCPMKDGTKNWCHDTAPKPKSLKGYDLPFSKNRLNFSYLLMSKTQKPLHMDTVRVIGDLRKEKGKSKISICKSDEPTFLSWLKKSKLKVEISRGDLVRLPDHKVEKKQEVRIETQPKTINFKEDI
jgi:ribosomal protein RSM22 (predicted rRNA methylase)